MDLDTLRYGDFQQLGQAITDWQQMTKQLADLKKDAEDNLKAKADKADWAGLNATVTREFVDKTAAEFADAHTQADSITKILSDTHGELVSYQIQLNNAVDRCAKKHLTVMDTGDGTFVVTQNTRPDWASDPSGKTDATSQQDIDALRTEIEHILSKATESDSSAAKVLQLLVDQAEYGFSDAAYTDRDSAAKAVAAAGRLAKILAKDPGDVTNTELDELNTALAQYKNDPLFAEKFATDVGPKRTMEFYASLVDDAQFAVNPRSREGLSDAQKERMKLVEGFEKQLGMTLATASHSDSDKMQTWKSDAINLGGQNVRPNGENPVYGFQVMSNLMRNGEYRTDFLHGYGDHLIAYEKSHTSDEYGGLQRRVTREDVLPWDHSGQWEQLHYGDANDAGRDPMTGFMEGLGHNSDASTQFFNEGDNFDYLADKREWPEDYVGEHAKTIAGYDSLGHALESATTGSPYGAHPPSLHRDADTARVAEKVVALYGRDATYKGHDQVGLSGAQLMHKQQGISDSLGKIGAAYIDDIDWAMDHDADKSLYAMDNGGRSSLGERAHFDAKGLGVTKFLSTLGQDPLAYTEVGQAQQVYSTSLVDAHPPTVDAQGHVHSVQAETAVRTGAEVQGTLDRARAEQIKAHGQAMDEAYNKAIDARMDRQKMVVGAVTGGMFSLVPEAETGLAATVIPIVSDQTSEVTGTLIEKNLDAYTEAQHRDNSEQYHAEGNQVYEHGFKASMQPAYTVLDRADHDSRWNSDTYQTLSNALRSSHQDGYTSGSQLQEDVGQLPSSEG
ncbi:hypothetical protein AB0I51_09815 [Streptomyces sp. NPDC050549]|uniref:hypothetical protein n=1 Tax=Streptomyces sp. NPDC050549 TaxID=3155406 RepID=UPI00341F5A04